MHGQCRLGQGPEGGQLIDLGRWSGVNGFYMVGVGVCDPKSNNSRFHISIGWHLCWLCYII